MDHRFVAPDKAATTFHHAPEEILIFATVAKFSAKRIQNSGEHLTPKQDITRPGLPPMERCPARVLSSLAESAADEPVRWVLVEERPHWSQHAVCTVPLARLYHFAKPFPR